jgi:hypothetical protein
MMLNGSAFNRVGLNGSTPVVLIQGSAALVAEGSLSLAGTLNHGARVTIVGDLTALFSADRVIYGSWPISASADSVIAANVNHGARGNWAMASTWQALVIRVIDGKAGFDATSVLEIIPGAVFGSAAWSITGTFAPVGTLSGALSGSWLNASDFTSDALATRMMAGNWAGSLEFWPEPTLASGGTVYHEGYTFWDGGMDWENIPYLTATFINGAFQSAGADWVGNAHGIYAGRGQWTLGSTWSVQPRLVSFTTVTMTGSSSLSIAGVYVGKPRINLVVDTAFSGKGNVKHAVRSAWTAGVDLAGTPSLKGAMRAGLSIVGTLTSAGVRNVKPEASLNVVVTLVGDGLVTQPATGTWVATGSTLLAGAIRVGSPAPVERRFTVPATPRRFAVSPVSRSFKVAA